MSTERSQPLLSYENEVVERSDGPHNTTASTNEASTSSLAPKRNCGTCSKPEREPEKPLKPCSKCQSVSYCSRECQKADFKKHKKVCAAAAQEWAKTANLKIGSAPRVPKEGHRGGLQKWQFDT